MNNKERKKLQLELAKENLEKFFYLIENNTYPQFEKEYIQEIMKISQGFNIRLTREQKLKFCKKCLSKQTIKTREIRLNPQTKTKDYICKICSNIRRFKYK